MPRTRAQYSAEAAKITPDTQPDLRWARMVILSTHTVDMLVPFLKVEAASSGVGLEIIQGPFGQLEEQVLNPTSLLYDSKPDIVLILARLEELAPNLAHRFLSLSASGRANAENALIQRVEQLMASIRAQSPAMILLANLVPPLRPCAGSADGSLPESQSASIQRMNSLLAIALRKTSNATVVDLHRAAQETGLSHWRDARMEWLARAPLSTAAMTACAQAVSLRLRAALFPAKKCLVLDMDNTLWGGVLGELGVKGIKLGPDYPGNVFLELQRIILALRDRGVILAAASKNNAADVEQALEAHPSSVLKREHFSAFQVHWEDKATSLRRIAKELNIGTDALVFMDDDPVERAWVTAQLPEVAVVPMPEQPTGYADALLAGVWFEPLSLTEEDIRRSAMYAEETARAELRQTAATLEEFLSSLQMQLTLGHIDEHRLPRVAQMLGKTNQFNLTTRRHSAADIQQMLDAGAIGLWAQLKDRFGDNGIIAAALAVPEGAGAWRVDSFLMSCRVMGRTVETALLAALEAEVRKRGGTRLIGDYIPTEKNQPAAAFYSQHGYAQEDGGAGGWSLTLEQERDILGVFQFHPTMK